MQWKLIRVALTAPAFAMVLLAGCGGGEEETTTTRRRRSGGDGGAKAAKAISPGSAKIVGRVVFSGKPPQPEVIKDMQNHQDKDHCLQAPKTQQVDQTWRLGQDNGVPEAVVWLAAPSGSKFEVVPTTGDVVLDQPFCVYIPHIFAIRPGEKLTIKNSASILHNTKWEGDPTINPARSETIAPGKEIANIELKPQGDPITFRCDVHKWMEAKCFVSEHQYIAVTDADGKFAIANVPTDVELQVVAWHEGAGYFNGGKSGKAQTFKAGDNKLDLTVSAQ